MPAVGQTVAQTFWHIQFADRRLRLALPPPYRCAVRVLQDQPGAFGEWCLVPCLKQATFFEFMPGKVLRTRQIGEAALFARQYARPCNGPGRAGSRLPIREPTAPGTETVQQLREETLRMLLHFLH